MSDGLEAERTLARIIKHIEELRWSMECNHLVAAESILQHIEAEIERYQKQAELAAIPQE